MVMILWRCRRPMALCYIIYLIIITLLYSLHAAKAFASLQSLSKIPVSHRYNQLPSVHQYQFRRRRIRPLPSSSRLLNNIHHKSSSFLYISEVQSIAATVSREGTRLAFSTNYLESLTNDNSPADINEETSPSTYLESLSNEPIPNDIQPVNQRPVFVDLEIVSAETPSEHYAKNHPGAGWAGYHHPMFGGYLNNLNQTVCNEEEEGKSFIDCE